MSCMKKIFLAFVATYATVFTTSQATGEIGKITSAKSLSQIQACRKEIREQDITGKFRIMNHESVDYKEIFGPENESILDEDAIDLYVKKLSQIYGKNIFVTFEMVEGEYSCVFNVENNSLVSSVRIDSDKLLKSIIEKHEKSLIGKRMTRSEIIAIVRNIISEAVSKGFYGSVVDFRVEKGDDQSYVIVFSGNSNINFQIRSIKIKGLDQDEFNEIQSTGRLSIKKRDLITSLFDDTRTGTFNIAEVENNISLIKEFLIKAGYADASIRVGIDNENGTLSYIIDKGKKYLISKIVIDGNTSISDEEIQKVCMNISNSRLPYSQYSIDLISKAIKDVYFRVGKVDVSVSFNIDDVSNYLVSLSFNVSEGEVFSINEISIEGNNITDSSYILREMGIYPGASVNILKLNKSIERMKSSQLYKNASYMLTSSDIPGTKNIRVIVEENGKFFLSASIGISGGGGNISVSFPNMPSFGSKIRNWFEKYGYDASKGEGIACNMSFQFMPKFWKSYSLEAVLYDRMLEDSMFSWQARLVLYKKYSGSLSQYIEHKFAPKILTLIGSFDNSMNIVASAEIEVSDLTTEMNYDYGRLLYRDLLDTSKKYRDRFLGANFEARIFDVSLWASLKYCHDTNATYSKIGMNYSNVTSLVPSYLYFRVSCKAQSILGIHSTVDNNVYKDNMLFSVPLSDQIIVGAAPATLEFRGLDDARTLYDEASDKYILPKSAMLISGEILFNTGTAVTPTLFLEAIFSSRESLFRSFFDNGINENMIKDKSKATAIASIGFVCSVATGPGGGIQIGIAKVFNPNRERDALSVIFNMSGGI